MPPLTLENAGVLVPGGVTAADIEKERKDMQAQKTAAAPETLRGVVERAFYYQGKTTKVGEELSLPRVFALEMQAAKKLRLVVEQAAPAPAVDKPAESASKKKGIT